MPKKPFKSALPTPQMEAFRTDMLDTLNKHSGPLEQSVMLALAAYTVGQIIALQDQTKMTFEMAYKLVETNIEKGNQHVISELTGKTDGSA